MANLSITEFNAAGTVLATQSVPTGRSFGRSLTQEREITMTKSMRRVVGTPVHHHKHMPADGFRTNEAPPRQKPKADSQALETEAEQGARRNREGGKD
jgi:hypothetical protein